MSTARSYNQARTDVEILRDGGLDIDQAVAFVEEYIDGSDLADLSFALEAWEIVEQERQDHIDIAVFDLQNAWKAYHGIPASGAS